MRQRWWRLDDWFRLMRRGGPPPLWFRSAPRSLRFAAALLTASGLLFPVVVAKTASSRTGGADGLVAGAAVAGLLVTVAYLYLAWRLLRGGPIAWSIALLLGLGGFGVVAARDVVHVMDATLALATLPLLCSAEARRACFRRRASHEMA